MPIPRFRRDCSAHPAGPPALMTALVSLALAAGCAPAARAPAAPSPSEIPALQARLATDSTPRTRTLLAAAYRAAGQPERARALLEPLVAAGAGGPAARFFLGLTYEDLHRYEDARKVYQAYLSEGKSDALKAQVRDRLALLDREELQEAARSALVHETELRGTAPTPRTIAVFPFLEQGDTTLRPLGRALAELLTTDLGQTDRLKVLERSRVQFLIDEMKLGQSGLVAPSTAARAGHLLGAGRIVQGRIEPAPGAVGLQALLVRVGADTSGASRPLAERGPLPQLFDMEKSLALGIYDAVGIQLTTAERERVTRKATANVQALLAFGFGLEAQDAGDYAEAIRQFQRAVDLDPGFGLARTHLQQARQLAAASTQAPGTLMNLAMLELGPGGLGVPGSRLETFDQLISTVPDPEFRDPFAEAFGQEGLVRAAGLNVILRIP